MDKALDPPLIPAEARSETEDELRDAIQAYRTEVARLKAIGLNQYGEPAEVRETPVLPMGTPGTVANTMTYDLRPSALPAPDRAVTAPQDQDLPLPHKTFADMRHQYDAMQQAIIDAEVVANELGFMEGKYLADVISEQAAKLVALRAALLVLVGEMAGWTTSGMGGQTAMAIDRWVQEIQRLLEAEA